MAYSASFLLILCTKPSSDPVMRESARPLGEYIQAEDGAGNAVHIVEQSVAVFQKNSL